MNGFGIVGFLDLNTRQDLVGTRSTASHSLGRRHAPWIRRQKWDAVERVPTSSWRQSPLAPNAIYLLEIPPRNFRMPLCHDSVHRFQMVPSLGCGLRSGDAKYFRRARCFDRRELARL